VFNEFVFIDNGYNNKIHSSTNGIKSPNMEAFGLILKKGVGNG
jgi:hypothetical protein